MKMYLALIRGKFMFINILSFLFLHETYAVITYLGGESLFFKKRLFAIEGDGYREKFVL